MAPAWQSALTNLSTPDYSLARSSAEWDYLRILGRSSLVDLAVYQQFREKASLAQKLPQLDQSYADIVARNKATFDSTIPALWISSDATQRYMNDLDYYSSLWHSMSSF